MTQELKEKIARNAASGWCRCFKCDGIVNDTNTNCDKERLFTCHQWYNGYRTALLALGDERIFANLWKNAQGDDLPEIDREVIVLYQPYQLEGSSECAVGFAHRPPERWYGRNLDGEEHVFEPKTYDKGEWNIPNVVWWLDLDLPIKGK